MSLRKGCARSETLACPFERRASIARRVGSARAAKVRLRESGTYVCISYQ
jgi:hypothetical protein